MTSAADLERGDVVHVEGWGSFKILDTKPCQYHERHIDYWIQVLDSELDDVEAGTRSWSCQPDVDEALADADVTVRSTDDDLVPGYETRAVSGVDATVDVVEKTEIDTDDAPDDVPDADVDALEDLDAFSLYPHDLGLRAADGVVRVPGVTNTGVELLARAERNSESPDQEHDTVSVTAVLEDPEEVDELAEALHVAADKLRDRRDLQGGDEA